MKLQLIKKYVYIILGSLSLMMGVVGIFLPIIPTTPFLLLTALCYLRGSERMYHWLMHHKILGEYLYCYLTFKAIPKKTKVVSVIFLWITLSISIVLLSSLHIRLFLLLIGICVTAHLIFLKTLSYEELQQLKDIQLNKHKDHN